MIFDTVRASDVAGARTSSLVANTWLGSKKRISPYATFGKNQPNINWTWSVMAESEHGTTGALNPQAPPPPSTVLVVEDNDNDAELLRLMFRRSHILNPVQVVESVDDAIEYLAGQGRFADRHAYPFPSLMLVDSHLRNSSGFDLLRWLQANKATSPRAVVMLTGSDVRAFRTSYDLGAHSFLTKPLRFEDFQNMVTRVRGIKLTKTPEGHLLETEAL